MSNEDRLLRVENSLSALVELAQKADERMTRIEEAQLRSEERWKRAEERWERAEQRWERTEEGVRSLLAIAEIHEREINAMVEAHVKLAEALRATQSETDRQLAETNERLNSLIEVVERYISERRHARESGGQEADGRES